MQKIIWLLVLPAIASATPPDEETKAKIAAWTKAEVDKQLNEAKDLPGTMVNISGEAMKLDDRLNVLEKTAQFYSNIKNRRYKSSMVLMQDEIVKACCPLASGGKFDNVEWYRPRKGKRQGAPPKPGRDIPNRQEALKFQKLDKPVPQKKPAD